MQPGGGTMGHVPVLYINEHDNKYLNRNWVFLNNPILMQLLPAEKTQ